MKSIIDANRQDSGYKKKKQDSKIEKLVSMVEKMMYQIQISNSSPDNMDSPKSHYANT